MKMRDLTCAVCRSDRYRVRYAQQIPSADALDFSARRNPQKCHARIVECQSCGLVYSNPYFDDDVLRPLYRNAGYIDEQQLQNMGADYLREFERAVGSMPRSGRVLEIGCANGFFLQQLLAAGFSQVVGVEPGQAAVARADAVVRERIIGDFFRADLFPPASFDAVCCFQILDHIPQPDVFLRDIHRILKPGGVFLTINHNIRATLTRVLGERSPMYDIEHICLFDKRTIRQILGATGFDVQRVAGLTNQYTVAYAVKMFPFPAPVKRALIRSLESIGLGDMTFRVSAGNMIAVGRKAG